MRFSLYIVVGLFILGCNKNSSKTVVLNYGLYQNDSLLKQNALTIKYTFLKGDSLRLTAINSFDSTKLIFKERLTDSGIYRSVNDSPFMLTHSFVIGKQVEVLLPNPKPLFLNTWIRAIKTKNYKYKEGDSLSIIFYDEELPRYSFTSSYYCKKLGYFFDFYDQRTGTHFKLNKIEGVDNGNKIIEVANELINDTLFFGKYYRLPIVSPPPK